jgi:hypothetical protein
MVAVSESSEAQIFETLTQYDVVDVRVGVV